MKNTESQSECNKKTENDLTLTLNSLVKENPENFECEENNLEILKIKNDYDLNHNVKNNKIIGKSDETRVKFIRIFKKIINNEEIPDEQMKLFINSPFPKGEIFECNILVSEQKISVYSKLGERFILNSLKTTQKLSSKYIISKDFEKFKASDKISIIAYLRSNFLGTEFSIYDTGRSPKDDKASLHSNVNDDEELRCHLGNIVYTKNFTRNAARKMNVYIPEIDSDTNESYIIRPDKTNFKMYHSFKENSLIKIKLLVNKPPIWDGSKLIYFKFLLY